MRGSDVSSKLQASPPAPQTVTSPWITADNSNSNDSSGSSNSSTDDGYKTEVGECSLPSPCTEPVQTSTSSSREIIEGLERELEWLQQTLEEAEREWQEVSCGYYSLIAASSQECCFIGCSMSLLKAQG